VGFSNQSVSVNLLKKATVYTFLCYTVLCNIFYSASSSLYELRMNSKPFLSGFFVSLYLTLYCRASLECVLLTILLKRVNSFTLFSLFYKEMQVYVAVLSVCPSMSLHRNYF
jgi:hypothetical protein